MVDAPALCSFASKCERLGPLGGNWQTQALCASFASVCERLEPLGGNWQTQALCASFASVCECLGPLGGNWQTPHRKKSFAVSNSHLSRAPFSFRVQPPAHAVACAVLFVGLIRLPPSPILGCAPTLWRVALGRSPHRRRSHGQYEPWGSSSVAFRIFRQFLLFIFYI